MQDVARHRDDVGELAGFERAGFAIDAEQFCGTLAAGHQRCSGCHAKIDVIAELLRVEAVRKYRRIGAEGDLHADLQRVAEHRLVRGPRSARLRADLRWIGVGLVPHPYLGHARGHEVHDFLLHQLQRRRLQEAAVFDRVDTGFDRELRGEVAMRVRRDFSAPCVRLGHDRGKFGRRKLRHIDRIEFGQHAAGRADLDYVCAVFHLQTRRQAAFLRAIAACLRRILATNSRCSRRSDAHARR